MMEKGLANEVQKLKDMGCDSHMVSMQGLGYKEVLAYLNGEYSLMKPSIVSTGHQTFCKKTDHMV